jgi:hypothetical protein
MSASGKTKNYNLGIYVGTDVTDWLGTFNGNMNKIDAQMKVNANEAASAKQTAGVANSTATAASEKVDTLKTNVNKNGTDIISLQNTVKSQAESIANNTKSANEAKQTATTAQSSANTANDGVNNIQQWKTVQLTVGTGSGSVYLAYNTALKLFNIYGRVNIGNGNNGSALVGSSILTSIPTGFFTEMGITTERIINNLCFLANGNGIAVYTASLECKLRNSNNDIYITNISGVGKVQSDRASYLFFSNMSYAGNDSVG